MAASSGCLVRRAVVSPLATLSFLLQVARVSVFTVLSRDQLYVLNAGETVDMDCEFYTDRFSLFDNPVLWTKSQFDEETRINIMGNINEPFVETGRFKVIFMPQPPRYRLILTVKDLSLEDSGNYTCEVRGPESQVILTLTHRIFVRAQVADIVIVNDNITGEEPAFHSTPHAIDLIERLPTALQCVAVGGNPPPDVTLSLQGHYDINHKFHSDTFTALRGTKGLRTMHSRVHRWTNDFVVDATDDGNRLACDVTVPGLPTNTSSTKIRVQFAPVMTCPSAGAYEGDKNVYVACTVRAKPRVTALFWIVDVNGTTVSEGQIVDEYWTLVTDRSDGVIETKLFMHHVRKSNFRSYTLVAENMVGIKRADVELLPKDKEKPGIRDVQQNRRPGGSSSAVQGSKGYTFIRGAYGIANSRHRSWEVWPLALITTVTLLLANVASRT